MESIAMHVLRPLQERAARVVLAAFVSVGMVGGCSGGSDIAQDCERLSQGMTEVSQQMTSGIGDPAQIEQTMQQSADDLRALADEMTDPELEQAVRDSADEIEQMGQAAAGGEMPDANALSGLTTVVAERCGQQ
jgi:NH3-dependent NAD+ synthetase